MAKPTLYPVQLPSFKALQLPSTKMSASAIVSKIEELHTEIRSLKDTVASLQSALATKAAPAPAKSGRKPRAQKEKDPNAPKRERTEWGSFTDRVRSLLKENGYTSMDLAVGCLQFCKALKTENAEFSSWEDADILARRSAWIAPETKPRSKAGSVASASVAEEEEDGEDKASAAPSEPKKRGPKKGTKLTDEQKAARNAKAAATREAKKAAKTSSSDEEDAPSEAAAPSPQAAAPPSPPAPIKVPVSPKEAPPAKTVAAANAGAAPAAGNGFKPVILAGKRYYVNLQNGHTYFRLEDESQGDWAGLFTRVGGPPRIEKAPQPAEEDDDELQFDE